MRKLRRAAAAVATGAVALGLSACGGPPLPPTVAEGTVAQVAWRGALTTLNAASGSGVAPGDHDIAALTRARFVDSRQGIEITDSSFGTVEIIEPSESAFTVRYDLAEPRWSDGIAVDAADLMLAWAAGSAFDDSDDADDADVGGFDAARSGLAHSDEAPEYDEFARSIEVTYEQPVSDWQTAIDVAVPAHVAGQLAFGIDDPMAAKQAVIDAVRSGDAEDLASLAEAWNDGLDVSPGSPPSDAITVSSGPYLIESVEGSPEDGDQRVTLVANGEYAGATPVAYHRIVFQQDRTPDAIDRIGSDYDVVQTPVADADFTQVRDLERDDYGMSTGSDGRMWALLTRVDRWPFDDRSARSAFLRTVPADEVITAASGDWKSAYTATSAALFPPDADGYRIALEDAGFEDTFARADDPSALRDSVGLSKGTSVCVLYDTDSPFARKAFTAMKDAVAEAGWRVTDCGHSSPAKVVESGGDYAAILTTVPVPETPADIARQWSEGQENLTQATSDERDALIEKLGQTVDPYDARDVRVEIEKTIVDQSVMLPLAMDPVVLVSSRDMAPVSAAEGRHGALLADPLTWAPTGYEAEAP